MRAVCLISGGIDSPVAAYLMACRGADVVLLHMDNLGPSDPREIEKVKDIARLLSERPGVEGLYVCPYWEHQNIISRTCVRSFQCVLCKRFMLMTAQAFARRENAEAIITGDSLGQVASQTLHNIQVEQMDLDIPVLRPLIGLDKLEIEAIAKRAGTFELSIRKNPPCPYVPRRPQTVTGPEAIRKEEAKLDVKRMLDDLVQRIERIDI